jgi:tetratricopeptide (TPR) repeat protein
VRELRYNLGEAYQDADRHAEALEIFRELYRTDPDEQRYAVHLFVSCQAFGHIEEMRAVVDDLDGRRRGLFVEAQARVEQFHKLARQRAEERKAARDAAGVAAAEPEAEAELGDAAPDAEAYAEPGAPKPGPKPEPLLTAEERKEFAYWQNLTRFQPPVIDYLKAQILTRERRYADALDALERVTEADLARPGLFLQTAELYGKLHQWEDAERVYAKALTIDPDNAHAHAGMCRTALRRRDFRAAAQSALDAIQRLYHYPMAHFLLGSALAGLGHDARAAEAFRVALSLNPNFPQAHLRLAMLLKRRLNLPAAAQDHLRLFRELRGRRPASSLPASPFIDAETAPNGTARAGKRTLATGTTLTSGALTLGVPRRVSPEPELAGGGARPTVARVLPPLQDEVVVVSGLPRSGTSMIMQMLAAGGVPILTDNLRQPDEDNPRGYFEYEPVKKLHQYPNWISEARGKAVKIVAPLIPALPAGIRCRLIFIERNLEEILASQSQMLKNRGESIDDSPARRARLKEEYSRLLQNVRALLKIRPESETLFLGREAVLSDPPAAAAAINRFLGGNLSEGAMAAEVKPSLHRQRASALADA